MEIIGYIASILIGLSLGLIGGGGSILTVPLLVYLFGTSPTTATSYSLFIVGASSLIGAWRNHANGNVNLKTALLFGVTSITTVLLTRRFIIPAIPENLFAIDGWTVTKSMFTMVLFALLMLMASVSMIKGRKEQKEAPGSTKMLPLILYGIGIGLVTGFLGAGGGFLLIPALVFFVGLDMKTAIGTSLAIIAMNSLIGFVGDIGIVEIDWLFLLSITAIAVAGIFVGIALGKKIDGAKLRKGFGWFVLAMGILILIKEL
ncbi:MAG: sulfite exporter TauE/SafE family protein [Chitinophagales bacterium]|nr:sulfite exporter TauE/SafE family protein [Chitinophagaceae bacterium]MCB9063566.1 sulfite exporter TauE/SafE family protein [Chitinophagales bacterium]